MNTSSNYKSPHTENLFENPEAIEAIRWIHSLQNNLADSETKIYSGEFNFFGTVFERTILHATRSAIRKLELLGYDDEEADDLAVISPKNYCLDK